MDSSIGSRFDYSLLDSLEWSGESYTLSSFLDEFSSSLPHVVKVFQGFCGDACSGTIDSGQILVLHSLHEETKILAKNAAQETELLIPKDFQVKVEMIPKNSLEESTSVRELLQTFPKYFRALSDIPSHKITSGSMFKIIRQKGYSCFECLEIINDGEEREVRLPFSLKGRFQALQDNREFLIDEVYAEEKDNLEADEPVNIHFVKSCLTGISVPGLNVESLYDLGTVRLVGECEIETVFATLLSSEDGKIMTVFPKDLEITVHSAKTNEHYDSVRRTIKDTQIKTLKRIGGLNRRSLYLANNPVRQFPQTELEPPALPIGKTRTKSETQPDSTAEKKRSRSTPPPPPRVTLETKDKESPKKPLKKAVSVPCPRPDGGDDKDIGARKDSLSLKRPSYKPPDIPHQSQPPLPPKERSKPSRKDKKQNLPSGQETQATEQQGEDGQRSDPESPPIPPPRPRRRQKSLPRRKDVKKSIISGYEQMDGFGHDQEYEEMDGSWIAQEGTLEEIFGDATGDVVVEDATSATDDKFNRKEEATQSKVSGSEVNNNVPRNVKEMVVLPHCVDDQRERVDSMDYENTKELKLAHLKKGISEKKGLHNDTDDQRERIDSMDYENTKELKLARLKAAGIFAKTVLLQKDGDEQRERIDSMDYENTKELKLDRLKKAGISEKMVHQNDVDDQRERADSVDYENTPKVKSPKAMKHREIAITDELLEEIPRTWSVDYENTKELKIVPPGRRTNLSDDTSQEIPRTDSIDYENTKELKLKIPSKKAPNTNELDGKDKVSRDKQENEHTNAGEGDVVNKKVSGKNGVTKTEQAAHTLVQKSQSSSPCSNDTNDISTKESASAEALSDPSCMESKPVAKTEQFLKNLNLGREVPSDNDAKIEPEGNKKESSAEETKNRASDGIYYTTMADNVADPSYYITMLANNSLQGDIYEAMDADENDATYMPMNVSYVEDDSIYENDVSDTQEDDSDEMDDYEKVDLVVQRTPRKKTQVALDKEEDKNHFSDAYEQVDIIQQIESALLDKKGAYYEKMDIPQGNESYEEIDPPLTPSSNHLDVVSRERPGSDSYEDIDFPINNAHCYLTKTKSNDISTPPTPPQRRAKKLRKNLPAGEVKVGDSKDQIEALSSSPKSCDQISNLHKEDFEDLESLQVHMAVKESERQMLFDKALLFKNKKQQPPNSESPKNSPETTQQESCKDKVPTAAVDQVAEQYVKSRPPAPPPPRKPLTYLDVEPTRKPPTKPIKQKPLCNYSEIIGKVQTKHSSKEDDMEYIDDIELHYFQKEHMEKEKQRKERKKEKNDNAKDSESNDVTTKETIVKDDGKIPSSNGIESGASGESEIGGSVAANIQKFQNDSKVSLQDSKKPVITKPPPLAKKPIVKKKPTTRTLSAPIAPKNVAHKPVTLSNSSHESITPITSQNLSQVPNKPTTPCPASRNVNRPIALQSPSRVANKTITSACPSSHDVDRPITSQSPSRVANKPITSACPSSHDVDKPITSHSPSRVANKPTTPEHPSRAANKPITRHSSEKPVVTMKPVVAKRSLNPPPKPRRTFVTENTHESSKAGLQNDLNTQNTCTSSNAAPPDTPPWNDKSSQTTTTKQSSSEEKVSHQRTKPPKPLPRRKSQI